MNRLKLPPFSVGFLNSPAKTQVSDSEDKNQRHDHDERPK